MLSRYWRLLVMALLAFGAMAGTVAIPAAVNPGAVLAQEPDECQLAAMDVPGYRDLRDGEFAVSMPPIDDVIDCDDPLTFYRELWTEVSDEPMLGRFPDGKIGFYAISGAFKMTLIKGFGTVFDCEGIDGPCTAEDVEQDENRTFDILEGDSFIFTDPDGPEGEPLEFLIADGLQAGGGGVRAALEHNGSHARVAGSTTKGGGFSPMGCDRGGCY